MIFQMTVEEPMERKSQALHDRFGSHMHLHVYLSLNIPIPALSCGSLAPWLIEQGSRKLDGTHTHMQGTFLWARPQSIGPCVHVGYLHRLHFEHVGDFLGRSVADFVDRHERLLPLLYLSQTLGGRALL